MTSAIIISRLEFSSPFVPKILNEKARQLRLSGVSRSFISSIRASSESIGISDETKFAKLDLLDAISGTERGLKRSSGIKNRILKIVQALKTSGAGTVTSGDLLSGTWELLWTTEKETLFIFDNASIFGTEAGETFQVSPGPSMRYFTNHATKEEEIELKTILISPLLVSHLNSFSRLLYLFSLQPIDVRNSILLNVITFPPLGSFEVQASIGVASPQRINFE